MSVLSKRNIPNFISVFRFCLIPVFVYFYFVQRSVIRALVTFLIAGASDVVDGFLARHNGWISNLGKILDPAADKCMQSTVLVCLSIDKVIPWWISLILITKEALMLLGATHLIKKFHTYAQSGWYGKGAVVVFYAIVAVLMLFELNDSLRVILSLLIIVAMLFALSMYYIKIYRSNVSDGNTDCN